ncbi:MAG: hypothetical protein J6J13_02515 [Clostridia bacterium]|nr:hypothetical protein [Clostridia bacterium]
MKTKRVLKILFAVSLCFLTFILTAYFYLEASFEKQNSAADTKNSNIPYSTHPENSGVLFVMPDGSGMLIYLDFSQNCISAIFIDDCDNEKSVFYGYPADYRIEGDYTLLSGIIDNIGGIDLETDGEALRYTGVQVTQLLSYTDNLRSALKEIVPSIFTSISKNGFSVSDIKYILENCSYTTLTLPECLNWSNYIAQMADTLTIIG